MNLDIDFFTIDKSYSIPEKGRILVSEPFLNDSYFKRSIILLTEHSKDGSVGFVLNKPVDVPINEMIKDFPVSDFGLSVGGPVNTNTIHYIHTLGELVPNSVHIINNLFWGGDFEMLKEMAREGSINSSQIRFFLGYSGWYPKQLEGELARNSWLVTDINVNKIMKSDINTIWKDTLQEIGGKYKIWINSPENPSLN